MRRPLPSLLALALAALLLAACGDSDGDGDAAETTTAPTTTAAPTTSPPDETDDTGSSGEPTEEALADQLVTFGLEEEEATCLAGELAEGGLDASTIEELTNDPSQVLGAVQACDIPISRLLEVAGGLLGGGGGGSGGDPAAAIAAAITQALGSDVVSEEQARCIADELLAQGRDVTALSDLSALEPILEGCGVSASDIGG